MPTSNLLDETRTGQSTTEDEEILNDVIKVARFFSVALGEDTAVGITDREKFLHVYDPKGLFPMVKAGRHFTRGGALHTSITSGRRFQEEVDASRLGIPFVVIAAPIKNKEGKVIGGISLSTTVEKQEKMKEMAKSLEEGVEKISFTATGLSAASQQLAAGAQELAGNAQQISQEAQAMDKVLSIINEVAQRTHLLGLNAAIEAARAGEHGRGFNVVAEEIRKLAGSSRSSVQEVTSILKHVQEAIESFTEQIEQISAVSEEQAANIGEIAVALDNLRTVATKLNDSTIQINIGF